MKKKKVVRKYKRKSVRVFVFGILCVSILSVLGFILGKVIVEIFDKKEEKALLEGKLATLKEKEDELKNEALKLQDPEYVARYAREKYFYSKDGEIILIIPDE